MPCGVARWGAGETEGAAGAEACCSMSGGPPVPWRLPSLSTLRAVVEASGVGGVGGQGELDEMEVVCRVAGGWQPEPGERRALLQWGCRRLAGAVWGGENAG